MSTNIGASIFDEATSEAPGREGELLTLLRMDLKNNRLVIIVGAGVTLSATADTSGRPLSRITWAGLIRNGLRYLVDDGYVDRSNSRIRRAFDDLAHPDTNDLLDAANILNSQLREQGQFPTWLESVFGTLDLEIRHPAILEVLKALHEKGATLLTTYYDDLLEKFCALRRIGRSNQDEIRKFKRGDLDGVFHVHGSYHDPHEVVLDTKDYYKVIHSDEVQNVLRTFLEYKTILFVGCGSGLEDPNFDALLKWASEQQGNTPNRHCLLVRDRDSLTYQPLVRLKYGADYEDLAPYLSRLLDKAPRLSLPKQNPNLDNIFNNNGLNQPAPVHHFSLDDLQTCLQKLSFTKPEDDIAEITARKGELVEASCSWINRPLETFLKSESRVLWIHGKAGKGKTMTTVHMIQTMKSNFPDCYPVILFFCQFDNPEQNSITSVLKSIIGQLLTIDFVDKKIHERLASPLAKEYATQGDRFFSPWFYNQALARILGEMLDELAQGCILIDALDECDSKSALPVLQRLINRKSHPSMKWIFTSRDPPSLFRLDDDLKVIDLEDSSVSALIGQGVQEFIQVRLHDLAMENVIRPLEQRGKRAYDCPESSWPALKRLLSAGAKGSFLWVALMIEQIRGESPELAVLLCKECPNRLGDLYDRILGQILTVNAGSNAVLGLKPKAAERILSVLCVSYKPLSLSQLAAAARLSDMSHTELPIGVFIKHCGSLLNIRDDLVQFVHLSVKDHLLNGRSSVFSVDPDQAHSLMMMSCLSCLRGKQLYSGINRGQWRQNASFRDYASLFWIRHGQELSIKATSDADAKQIREFLSSEQGLTSLKRYSRSSDLFSLNLSNFSSKYLPHSHLVEVAVAVGIGSFISVLWEDPREAPTAESLEKLLALASSNGHKKVVNLILEQAKSLLLEADAKDKEGWEVNSRKAAAKMSPLSGKAEVLRSVWTTKVTIPGHFLSIAAYCGYSDVVQFLADEVKMNVNDCFSFETAWTCPVSIVWDKYSIETSKIADKAQIPLITYSPTPQEDPMSQKMVGSKIRAVDECLMDILMELDPDQATMASFGREMRGLYVTVKLEAKLAKIDSSLDNVKEVLRILSDTPHCDEILRAIFGKRPSSKTMAFYDKRRLSNITASNGERPSVSHEEMLNFRIIGRLATPLEGAILRDQPEVVKLLLAFLDRSQPQIQKALWMSVQKRNMGIVRILLNEGIDPGIPESDSQDGLTILFATALQGNIWMVKLLLEYCDVTQSKILWNKALKRSYDSWEGLRSQVRDAAVVIAFRSISENFGDLPVEWTACTTYQGNDYYVNSLSPQPYVTWQDPRVQYDDETSMDKFWGRTRPPSHMLDTGFESYLDSNYDISAPSPSDTEAKNDHQNARRSGFVTGLKNLLEIDLSEGNGYSINNDDVASDCPFSPREQNERTASSDTSVESAVGQMGKSTPRDHSSISDQTAPGDSQSDPIILAARYFIDGTT